jgi:hypothetical protein
MRQVTKMRAFLAVTFAAAGCGASPRDTIQVATATPAPAAPAPAAASLTPGLAGAGAAASPTPSDPDDDAPPSRPPGTTRLRMRDHFDGLREIERAIVRGNLDAARERATSIVFDRADQEMPTWAPYLARLRAAASNLARAESITAAAHAETLMAAECAACHVATGAMLTFLVPPLPPDGGTLAERMARHQWAADRLWAGVIGLSDEAWRDGLEVLAAAPLPAAALTDDVERQGQIKKNARSLQQLSRYALTVTGTAPRARAYGQLLAVCGGCHARLPEDW